MEVIATQKFRLKTPTGRILLVPGSIFEPKTPETYIEKGLARPVCNDDFIREFKKVSLYLVNEFSDKSMRRLQRLVYILDAHWQRNQFRDFRDNIIRILDIPPVSGGNLEQKGGDSMAWKKFSTQNYPSSWDFKEFPMIEGIVTQHKTVTVNGEDRDCCLIATDDGDVKTVWLSAALQDLKAVSVGENVRVTYNGQRRNDRTKRTYNHFTLEIYDESDADTSFQPNVFDERKTAAK